MSDNFSVKIQRKPSDRITQELMPKLHGQQFAAVQRFVRRLIGVLSRHLKASPQAVIETKSQYGEALLSLVALLALAKRKILPTNLNGRASGSILAYLTADLNIDATQFGAKLTGLLLDKEFLAAGPEFLESLAEIFLEPGSQEILSDPMIVGWAYQCLIFERRKELPSRDICLTDLPALTQWFTPDWISKFLVSETLNALGDEKEFCFIDPCLGTGHIFVEALKQRLKRKATSSPELAIGQILASELFGCDLDRTVVYIAGFSIYLACRDLARLCELPLPQIYHFDGVGFGSLLLSDADRSKAKLFGLEGMVDVSKLKRSYSAVITNPPYLSHRLMPKELSAFLKKAYPSGRFDLYAAFIKLCMNLVEDNGVFALICQQSFMSITRYEELREELLDRFALRALVQLGSGVFASRKGEKVSNAIIIAQLQKQSGTTEGWRILSVDEQALAQRRGIRQLPKVDVPAEFFRNFPGSQFAFWCPNEIRQLFELPALESPESGIESSNGLFTCNNKRFLKYFWQVEAHESDQFVPYDKGGGSKWYYTTPLMLDWQDKGDVIRAYRKERGQSTALPGERHYFRPGVTYSYIGTRGFKARLLSPDSIFDIASSALFCDDPQYLLGFLNSSLARFLLGLLNPTINFQIGDLRRLPYKKPCDETRKVVTDAVSKAIAIARKLETYDKRSPNYLGPVLRGYTKSNASDGELVEACRLHRENLSLLNDEESLLQEKIDLAIFDLYGISNETRKLIAIDPWVVRNEKLISELPTDKQLLAEFAAGQR